MKRSLVLVTASLAAGLVVLFSNDRTDRTDRTDPSSRIGLPLPRKPRPTPDFWTSARVPDTGHDLPATVIRPEDLGVFPPAVPVDHPARITRAISENDLPAIHSATLSWFEHDPATARDWLAAQPTLEDLQPAISYIAQRISERGDLNSALQWAALLTDGTIREDSVFDIHALAIRNGHLSPADIPAGLIPDSRMEELLSGAPGD